MFNFPEPRAVDFILTDVRPSYLSDGVFFHGGKPGPTHKCVAKQLSPVKRKPNDPVPLIPELESRVLDRLASRGKAFYADTRSGEVDPRDFHIFLHNLRGIGEKFVPRDRRSAVIFPRSPRYEYQYGKIMNMKSVDPEKLSSLGRCPRDFESSTCEKSRDRTRGNDPEKPFWWKPDSLGEHYLEYSNPSPRDCFIDYPSKSGATRRKKSREEKDQYEDNEDPRWRPIYGTKDFPKTEEERRKGMSELLKPYLHELDKWYSAGKNRR